MQLTLPPLQTLAAAAAPPTLVLTHTTHTDHKLSFEIPPTLKDKPLVVLKALLQQTDTFSCAYRALFHAQSMHRAFARSQHDFMFEEHLKKSLLDEHMLNVTFTYVKDYLDRYHPQHDRTSGLCIQHVLGVCATRIPYLNGKILPVLLEPDQKIYAVHDPTPNRPAPLYYSQDFIRNYHTARFPPALCHIEFDASEEINSLRKQIKKHNHIVHLACKYPNHLFWASVVTDRHGYATLYVIDSGNDSLADGKPIYTLTTKVLEYVTRHNEKKLSRKEKRAKIAVKDEPSA